MRLRVVILVASAVLCLSGAADEKARLDWGFEQADEGKWTAWGREGSQRRCSENAHNGTHAMRVEPRGTRHFIVGNKDYVPLKPDTNYTLSGWVKTEGTNWALVGGILRDAEGKYIADDNVWTPRVLRDKDWVYVQTTFNSGDVALMEPLVQCSGDGGVAWFDDVCLEEGVPRSTNEFSNSAFAVCSTPGYPDMWGVSLTDPMSVKDWESGTYYLIDPDTASPVPGTHVLRFRIPPTGLRFGAFGTKRPTGTYTFSVYLKSDSGEGIVSVSGFQGKREPFAVSREWRRYSFTAVRTARKVNHTVSLRGVGTLWLAAPQLEFGGELTDWGPSPADVALIEAGSGAGERTAFVRKQAAIPRVGVAPAIDGRLNDPCWRSAWQAPTFVDNTTGDPVSLPCDARMACDENNIYIAFKNSEPIATRRRGGTVGNDSSSCFKPDSVEVFVAPGGADYFQLAVNPAGDLYDGAGYSPAWSSNATVAAAADDEGWNVEIMLPVSSLKNAGDDKGWSINLCRNRNDDRGITHYSAAAGVDTFHKPHRFMSIARMPIRTKTWDFISPKFFAKPGQTGELFAVIRSPGNAGTEFAAELTFSDAPDRRWRKTFVMTAAGVAVTFGNLPGDVDLDVEAQLAIHGGDGRKQVAKLTRKILHLKSPYDPASPVTLYAQYSSYSAGSRIATVKVGSALVGASTVRLTLTKAGETFHTKELSFAVPGETVAELPVAGLAVGVYYLWGEALKDGEIRAWAGDRLVMLPPKENAVRMNRFTRSFVCDEKPYFPLLFHPYAGRETPQWVFDASAKDGYNGLEIILPLIRKESSDAHFNEVFQRGTTDNLKIFFRMGHGDIKGFDDLMQHCCELADRARDYPSLVEYYIMDEPGKGSWETKKGYKESDLLRLADAVRGVDPYHPVTINYTEGHMRMDYPIYGGFAATDFYIYDCYPNMRLMAEPLEHFAEAAHRWNDVLARIGRCVCVWLPVWGAFDAVRTPTPDEWQNMALVSIISGSRGLLNWMELPYSVPLIKRIRDVNHQLQTICPAIVDEETRTQSGIRGSIHYALWFKGDSAYLMAANVSSSAAAELSLELDAMAGMGLKLSGAPFAADIALALENGTLQGTFPPCKSGIFRFARAAP